MIGQNSAVVDLGFVKLRGFIAWVFWLFVHIYFLIEYNSKLLVMIQWTWNYFTRNRGARLITGSEYLLETEIVDTSDRPRGQTREPLKV